MSFKRSILLLFCYIICLTFSVYAINMRNIHEPAIILEVDGGTLTLYPLNDNSIRVKFHKSGVTLNAEEIIYTEKVASPVHKVKEDSEIISLQLDLITAVFNKKSKTLSFHDSNRNLILSEQVGGRFVELDHLDSIPVFKVMQRFVSPPDEYLFGTGQFQDGYLNIRGLSRRLTQVNSQISIPFILSSKGYGLMWNNYGLTNFNPAENSLDLIRNKDLTESLTVDATGTSGNKRETRQMNQFTGTLDIPTAGSYAILLDVGQKMARKHHLVIDGDTLIDINNIWLPPTTSLITELSEGEHNILVEGEENDTPKLYWRKVTDETILSSPVAEAIDYTVFAGSGEEVISSYRELTGHSPMLPEWAFGYIHCRERYHTQDELLENALTFRNKEIPIDMIVQDWQYWGKYGWNAMRFDEERYPDPKDMVRQLHEMNIRFMVSVWSKIDKQSDVGKEMNEKGYYIPDTEWIDFFNPDAAAAYWQNFSSKMLPLGIDAWWLDATEPENDDLQNRMIFNSTLPGELYRNVYPMYVNKTVYEGLRRDDPEKRRAFILTRSAFSGSQRYGIATWSGDVGHDWETLRRQITAGLGYMSTGLPWWTYDAGGFFRPGNQYTNTDYHELFIRWFQTATFFPLLRVHGYMSNTEPWRYGEQVEKIVSNTLEMRYQLFPYIYSEASRVSFNGSTLMRPLVMDFAHDKNALEQKHQFMFGPSILVIPVTEPGVEKWSLYLPEHEKGWINFWSKEKMAGGKYIEVPVDLSSIPIFVKAGSIIPIGPAKQFSSQKTNDPIEIHIYPGDNASFTIYEDEGTNYNYEHGKYTTINLDWNDEEATLTIGERNGDGFPGMEINRTFKVVNIMSEDNAITVNYDGNKTICKLNN